MESKKPRITIEAKSEASAIQFMEAWAKAGIPVQVTYPELRLHEPLIYPALPVQKQRQKTRNKAKKTLKR